MLRTRIRILIVATLLATVTIISCALYFLADAIVTGAMKEKVMSLASVVSAGMDKNRIVQLADEKNPRLEQADFIYLNQVLQMLVKKLNMMKNQNLESQIFSPYIQPSQARALLRLRMNFQIKGMATLKPQLLKL